MVAYFTNFGLSILAWNPNWLLRKELLRTSIDRHAWACACLFPDSGKPMKFGVIEKNIKLASGEIDWIFSLKI